MDPKSPIWSRLSTRFIVVVFAAPLWLRLTPAQAQTPGTCEVGTATVDLDGNNVRARLYNTGQLFFGAAGFVYRVPKEGRANAVFAAGIWVGGLDGAGELRFAGSAYGPFEYWPGPLDGSGNVPSDCADYDRIYRVSRSDLEIYDLDGTATIDMTDWPWQLGAPVHDGDGNLRNYNLAAGDRPGLIGEQTAWWVMNDSGNKKQWSETKPIGLEVQVTAFALAGSEALENTTFYSYRILHKGSEPLAEAYLGIWSDPDLGDGGDDFVGSDTTLGLGFVYNGSDVDWGLDGYGDRPPALGFDFLQGPLVPDPSGGAWVDPDGVAYPGLKRLPMTNFAYYIGDAREMGNPYGNTSEPYDYMRSIWRDGTPMTFGGSGYGGAVRTRYMFPGDPASGEYWSEENTDGSGVRSRPGDRRIILSAGPFELKPGDVQEIVYGIVWSQGADRLSSVAQLKMDDVLVQAAYDAGLFSAPVSALSPTRVELHPNYPNPFNPSTVIRFGLPEAAGVTLEVFDVLGRRVMTVLSDTPYAAGYHDVVVRMEGLASGTYLYRLKAGGAVRHAKMVYVR